MSLMPILFWIAAALLAAGTGVLILYRTAGAVAGPPGPDPALGVYRRALDEIDDLAGRDLIGPEERRIARAEAARRLLGAAEAAAPGPRGAVSPLVVLAAAAIGPLLAVGIYLAVGSPGAPDQPFSGRLADWISHPERHQPPELAAALRAVAQQRPDDPEPLRRLAGLDLALGDPDGAIHALRKASAIAPARADLLATLGEVMVLKAAGTVDAEAQAVFHRVLTIDPASPTAAYYLGRAAVQNGDVQGGLARWRALLAGLPPADDRRAGLQSDIDAVVATGHLPQPQAESAAPPSMNTGAIQGMVDGLAARLQQHPDDPAGWVRLVRAYTVLGETPRRDAALAQARKLYAARPDVLRALQAALAPAS